MARVTKTGGMIALIPSAADISRLAVEGGEESAELHLTLAFLGDDVTGWSPAEVETLIGEMRERGGDGPITARVMGHARFNPDGGPDGNLDPCMVYLIGESDRIGPLREDIVSLLSDRVGVPPQHEPATFHITAGYGLGPDALEFTGPITFDRIRVAMAEQVTDIPLTGPERDVPTDPDDDTETKAGAKGKLRGALPGVGGLALIAADTGRVLMLQRALDSPGDPAAGTWEFPGGHLEPDDATSLHGAMREWAEEVGQHVPDGGIVAHTWTSPDGVYQGHVLVVANEDALDLGAPRALPNPDDDSEQVAWWALGDAAANPALRRECRRTPWGELRRTLAATRKLIGSKEKGAAVGATEVKAKVASEAGEQRYGLPIGTELGQARNATAAQAQNNDRARDQYATLVNANPRDYQAMLDGLSAADLKALTAITYSFRSSDPKVVQARLALASALRRKGLNVDDHGGLGRSGGGRAPAKRRAGTAARPRSRTASTRGRAGVNAAVRGDSVDANKLSDGERDRLLRAGWKGRPGDGQERLYRPGSKALDDEVEVKRTTTKPGAATGRAKASGHTLDRSEDDGDKYPIKTIGDVAAAVKRADKIKDEKRRDTVRAHIRKEAARLKVPNMIPNSWSGGPAAGKAETSGKPWEKSAEGGVLTSDDRVLLAGIESKVMSADPGAVKLREYWAHGKGRAKWRPGTPGDFERLRRAARRYIPAHMLNGWVANVHKLATGQWPGKGRGHGKTGEPDDLEAKGGRALLSSDDLAWTDRMDADIDPESIDLALDRYADMDGEVTSEEAYEQALADEVDWELEPDGTVVRADGADADGADADDEDGDDDGDPVLDGLGDDGSAALSELDALFAFEDEDEEEVRSGRPLTV